MISVTIGNSVATIDSYAFSGCNNISSVYNLCDEPQRIGPQTFAEYSNIDLYVPESSIESYKSTDVWKDFKQILPLSDPTITISTLPNGVVGTEYNQILTVIGVTPITWSLNGGSLPTELELLPTGVISGMPTTNGTFNFTVKATNDAGSDTKELSITIGTVGIESITQSPTLTAWCQDGMLHVSGLVAGEKWSVYTLAGVLVYEGKETSVALPKMGIYVVKAGEQAVKVIVND
jgi:hypothetical protein